APAQGEGVIEGQVMNGTGEGSPVSEVPVVLHIFSSMEEKEPLTATADAGGRFRFDGLSTASDYTYGAVVEYRDVAYGSDLVGFSEGQTALFLPVKVYETTTSDEAIAIERTHLIIDFRSRALQIGEMHVVINRGDRTYIGSEEGAGGRRTTLRFPLPKGATNLRFRDGALGERFFETEGGFVDTQPLRSGERTQLLFAYDLSYDSPTYSLPMEMAYAVENINVLVADVGAVLESERLTFQGTRGSEGQSYLNFTAQGLAKGERLTLNLSNLPQAIRAPESPVTQARPQERSQRALIWPIVGVAILLVFAFAAYYPRLRRRRMAVGPSSPAGAPAEDLNLERERLLQSLARLDDAFEDGQMDEEVYRQERAAMKAELVALIRRLEDRGS
ncbi:MAG: hypothetical protein ACETWB_05170, partial [Anaerolineae bacterium]